MTRLDELQTEHPLPTWRPFAWTILTLLTGALIWANFAQLDEVTVATGEVIPQGKVKVIQHLEGGIIEEIHVQEGDTVKAGDPLVQLDLASGGTNKEELQVRLDGQILKRARLEAEAIGADEPTFPSEEAIRLPQIVLAERKAFEARRHELNSTKAVLEGQVKQRELEVKELNGQKSAVERNLKLAQERLKMSKSLLSQGLTAKMEHLELEAEVSQLEGEWESIVPAIPRTEAAVEEARERVRELNIKFQREAQEQLGSVEQNIAQVKELLARATEQGFRATISSPIDGVVKNLRYNTIGGVVRPGEPILEVVPTGENLVIEAELSPVDRGYVQEGQKTVVKVTTYDFVRYGGLDGKVIFIAADSTTDPEGKPFFRVVVETDKTYLGEELGKLPITPGMEATVDIHTGQKSVLEYLVKPVLKMRHEAFRER